MPKDVFQLNEVVTPKTKKDIIKHNAELLIGDKITKGDYDKVIDIFAKEYKENHGVSDDEAKKQVNKLVDAFTKDENSVGKNVTQASHELEDLHKKENRAMISAFISVLLAILCVVGGTEIIDHLDSNIDKINDDLDHMKDQNNVMEIEKLEKENSGLNPTSDEFKNNQTEINNLKSKIIGEDKFDPSNSSHQKEWLEEEKRINETINQDIAESRSDSINTREDLKEYNKEKISDLEDEKNAEETKKTATQVLTALSATGLSVYSISQLIKLVDIQKQLKGSVDKGKIVSGQKNDGLENLANKILNETSSVGSSSSSKTTVKDKGITRD